MLHSLLDFSHSLRHPQSNWALLVLIPEWVGLCTLKAPVGLSNKLSCEAGSFSCCRLNPDGCFPSEVCGFISLSWSPGLHGVSHSPAVPPGLSSFECGTTCSTSHRRLDCLGPPATTLPQVLSAQLPISTPPTSLDECFFFISLVVQLPYSLIFCQFWLLFVFKLLLSFWLCEEAQCVYLRLHLGWKF